MGRLVVVVDANNSQVDGLVTSVTTIEPLTDKWRSFGWRVIELDGHEYHKTKYQRTHDAKRDRWLYGQGWHVLRFTGTEIHQDLDRCIDEICALAGVERLSSAKASP